MDNPYNQVIALLLNGSPSARVLDSRDYRVDQVWTIGRLTPKEPIQKQTHIHFNDPYVSKLHAILRYNEEGFIWEIKHMSRKSKTSLNGKLIDFSVWHPIPDQSVVYIAHRRNKIIFTYLIDTTLTPCVNEDFDTIPLASPAKSPPAKPVPQSSTPQLEPIKAPDPVKPLEPSKDQPWQVSVTSGFFDFIEDASIHKLLIVLTFVLVGLALFLILGAAVQ